MKAVWTFLERMQCFGAKWQRIRPSVQIARSVRARAGARRIGWTNIGKRKDLLAFHIAGPPAHGDVNRKSSR